MNVNESNQVGKTTPTNPQENGAQQAEQKPQSPPSIWLQDNGDGYFQVTDLQVRIEKEDIICDGTKVGEKKIDARREFILKFATRIMACIDKPLTEVQTTIQDYINSFLKERAEEKAKAEQEAKNREDGKALLDQLGENGNG